MKKRPTNKNNFEIKKFFPINSQTSFEDKHILLKVKEMISKNDFNYLEIGSFLGGSLTPFLIDKKCKIVISIDKRNQNLEDERNEKQSYENVGTNYMINNLKKYNLDIHKLKTFNGDVENFKTSIKFDLAFLDGVHTDINTFSDFINVYEMVKKDSIILFHDSSIIFKSINIIDTMLNKKKLKYKLAKFKNSEISGIFFGKYSKYNLKKKISKVENLKKFIATAEENLLLEQINNRLQIKFKISRFLKNKYPYKISLKKKKKRYNLDFHK